MTNITSRAILREIAEPRLNLHRGDGYWYFTYDAGDFYDDHSVYTMRLSDLSKERWVEEGRDFVRSCHRKLEDML
jgi:hypothetical protein